MWRQKQPLSRALSLTLNSAIWAWSNIAKTLDVARWARFFVVARRVAVFLDDILLDFYVDFFTLILASENLSVYKMKIVK